MALFGLFSEDPIGLVVEGADLLLRPPTSADYAAWSQLRAQSRGFLTPWEPLWPSDDLSRAGYRRRLRRYRDDIANDAAYPFLIFKRAEAQLVGGATLANVRRGIAQCATLGYWIGEPYARNGLMTAALGLLVPAVFRHLRLHRIEAACIPANAPSVRLLEKCGFTREGLARRYLCINGVWQDHLLYARLHDDPPPLTAPGDGLWPATKRQV
jgi:ribosomal-protein-alanine N-acetyltransferase